MSEDPFSMHNELLRYITVDLLVVPLKAISKAMGLSQSGRKMQLQSQLASRLNYLRSTNNVEGYNNMKRNILEQCELYHVQLRAAASNRNNISANSMLQAANAQASAARSFGNTPAYLSARAVVNAPSSVAPMTNEPIVFKSSPFFTLLSQLAGPSYSGGQPEGRHLLAMHVRFTAAQAEKLRQDPSYRIYMLSALCDDTFRHAAINFPMGIEIRVNGKIVSANLRGLKNKPGTAKPADLTSYMVKDANYRNVIEVYNGYSARPRFAFIVSLARQRSVQDIVTRIMSGRHLAKETVIAQIQKKNSDDDDIITTSTIMSLKCPLSFSRLQVPIRSMKCTHVSCFDATSYIQLQEQATTWQCPICNNYAPIEDIVVDSYVDDILKKTPNSVEAVEIDPTGLWRVNSTEEEEISDSDDDGGRRQASELVAAGAALEVVGSSPARAQGASRPNSNVIDLTSSDDEPEPLGVLPANSADTNDMGLGIEGGGTDLDYGEDGFGETSDWDGTATNQMNEYEFINSLPDFSDYVPSPPEQRQQQRQQQQQPVLQLPMQNSQSASSSPQRQEPLRGYFSTPPISSAAVSPTASQQGSNHARSDLGLQNLQAFGFKPVTTFGSDAYSTGQTTGSPGIGFRSGMQSLLGPGLGPVFGKASPLVSPVPLSAMPSASRRGSYAAPEIAAIVPSPASSSGAASRIPTPVVASPPIPLATPTLPTDTSVLTEDSRTSPVVPTPASPPAVVPSTPSSLGLLPSLQATYARAHASPVLGPSAPLSFSRAEPPSECPHSNEMPTALYGTESTMTSPRSVGDRQRSLSDDTRETTEPPTKRVNTGQYFNSDKPVWLRREDDDTM
ncbi:PINIT domain-containing protein [Lipomyces arxii]|uniref:PINIT domain-containing protein n=1 Tax=Lipomyces arxii TaxID=56418 RepID=UPI0034CFCF32